MRLLHIPSWQLREFFNESIPAYAILSHTWGDDEVTYEDMIKKRENTEKGFKKIEYTASQAIRDQYEYIWVDTCCIMKTSSAELTEAINSMYQWYKGAQVCYAYLSDVDASDLPLTALEGSQLQRSRWFTRGWTLQELLAPTAVQFYDKKWTKLGSKDWLSYEIEIITGIGRDYLLGRELNRASIAERMLWASHRSTTRTEDIAYSLLGLFDVNMPLLYGEGERAFMRLQEEIMKVSEDRSLFVWNMRSKTGNETLPSIKDWTEADSTVKTTNSGLLAPSPACFVVNCDAQFGFCSPYNRRFAEHYFMTNKGLSIPLYLTPLDPQNDIYVTELAKPVNSTEDKCGILLKCVSNVQKAFIRIRATTFFIESRYLGHTYPNPEPVYVDSNSFSKYAVESIFVKTDYQTTFPDFCRAAGLERTQIYSNASGVFTWTEDELPLDPGETCISSYLITLFEVRFFFQLSCTLAGRCLVGLEPDVGQNPEQLAREWNPKKWRVMRPFFNKTEMASITIDRGPNRFDISYSLTDMRESGSVHILLKVEYNSIA
jgi:hypothetical protein